MAPKHPIKGINKPELDKLIEAKRESQAIGEFLDWLHEQGMAIGSYDKNDEFYPTHISIEGILAKYFNIDMNKVEKERRKLLAGLNPLNPGANT